MFKVETMIFVNPTEHTIKLDALGFDPVEPKGEVELPLSVCAPYRMDNGTRGKSPVEQVAPQLQPKDPEECKAWNDVPAPPTPVSKIVANFPRHLQPQPESPGVKALREKAEASKATQVTPKAVVGSQLNVGASAVKS